MGQLQEIESELVSLGYQILAASPDPPGKLREMVGKHQLAYQLYSDRGLEAARAFGLAYRVNDQMMKALQSFGLDPEKAPGESRALLPVPAVFLIGTDGLIDFQYVNPDHRVRLPAQLVLAAARVFAQQ